jgi:hypothetical protein
MTDSWREIASNLAKALESFMAYDGYGEGGAADANRGDWKSAERAIDAYDRAVRISTIVTRPQRPSGEDSDGQE